MAMFAGNRFLFSNESEMVAKFAEEAVEVKLDASYSHEILDYMLLFLFGSHDTNTSVITCIMKCLVEFPQDSELMLPMRGTFREALDDFTYAGYTIPIRWKLHRSPVSTTKDPVLFSNAEDFDHSRPQILVFLHNIVKRLKWDLLIRDERLTCHPLPAPSQGLPIRLH
ncbi:hypothetical protein Peur_056327 [Populus x canadensis]|uniref:Cytochrome P450 n=1 Tax=Populus deltoides TaxID=3696 RepID=A0A8T2Z442_POPDE|nr:hypothetical protein H0E87_005836 [Populus deltoides]